MFKHDAREVEEFAFRGPLLQPQQGVIVGQDRWMVVSDLNEALRLYFLPLDEPDEAEKINLAYLPDVVAVQNKPGVMGSEPYSTVGLLMHERLRLAIAHRMGRSHPQLANEVDGALCAILDGRLVQSKAIRLYEEMFDAYRCGYWPCGMISAPEKTRLVVYSGGIVLDNKSLDVPGQ